MDLKCCCGDTAICTAPRASCLCTQSRSPAAVGTHTCVPTCEQTPMAPPSPSPVPPAQRGVAQGGPRCCLCVTRPCAALRRDPCSSDTVPAVVPGATHMEGKAPREPRAPCMSRSLLPGMAPRHLLVSSPRRQMRLWSSHFARLTAARPCSLPASQEGLWGEGDEDPLPAEPRGSGAPLGAQPQPDPLVQTCLLRDLEMGPLAQTQTLRDFEQVRARMAPPGCTFRAGDTRWTLQRGVERRRGGGAGGEGTGRGAGPGRAPRSPHRPHGCGAWGLRGSGFTNPLSPLQRFLK